jgi:hypothetical protein
MRIKQKQIFVIKGLKVYLQKTRKVTIQNEMDEKKALKIIKISQ